MISETFDVDVFITSNWMYDRICEGTSIIKIFVRLFKLTQTKSFSIVGLGNL